MTASTLDAHTRQLNEIVRHLVRLKARLKPVQAEDSEFARLRQRLTESHPQGKAGSLADAGYVFHLGALLAGERDSLTMGELSLALEVPDSTATRIVDWLVKSDYAERQADPADRRVVRVRLTRTGKATYKMLDEHICGRLKHLLRSFSAAERGTLIRLLGKLVKALEEEQARPRERRS